jgi:hypothetical protein
MRRFSVRSPSRPNEKNLDGNHARVEGAQRDPDGADVETPAAGISKSVGEFGLGERGLHRIVQRLPFFGPRKDHCSRVFRTAFVIF